jgi:kynurenine formamidase
MSNYVLLSHILRQDTPSYGNRDKVIIRVNSSIKAGETANSSCLVLSNNHIGTHIDVPRHFSIDGKRTIDYPIEDYVFEKCHVIDLPKTNACLIGPNDFDSTDIDSGIELLLIRTGYESLRGQDAYWNDNPGLAPELADYLRERFPKLRCVGFDFISVTSWQHRPEGRLAHKAFLAPENGAREIWAIEDMSLKDAPKEIKKVVVAPLLVEDGNGTAVTVIAEY